MSLIVQIISYWFLTCVFVNYGRQRERMKNHQTIQVVRNEAKSCTFKLKIKTRKLMQAETKSLSPLEIQNNMLHFFLIKVVK